MRLWKNVLSELSVQIAVGVHPAGECHRRPIVDLEILLVEHAELEDRNGLRIDAEDDPRRVVKRIPGGDVEVDPLVEGVESGERPVRNGADQRGTDPLGVHLLEGESRQGGGATAARSASVITPSAILGCSWASIASVPPSAAYAARVLR